MNTKAPFWRVQPREPPELQRQLPPAYKHRRDTKRDQQKNHPSESCQPTEMWEIITNGFETLRFGVACYIAIDKTSFLNYL